MTPKEALKRKEFYMLWVTRSQTPLFSIFYFKCVSQVLCRPDHSVCVRLLQSVRPKLYRGRSFPVFCRSGELCLQLHWKAFLWHSHGQVQNMLVNIHKNILRQVKKHVHFPLVITNLRTSYRTAMGVEMVLLTALVASLSTTSLLGKVRRSSNDNQRNLHLPLETNFFFSTS